MISTLRALFLGRLLREKLLLVAFALLLVMFWLSSISGRARLFFTDEQKASLGLADQARWLAHRAEIEAFAEKAASGFDPSKTLDATQLLGKVTQLATNAGLHDTRSGVPQEPEKDPTGRFSFHTLDFSINKADYTSLKSFYFALQALKPYLGIQKFELISERSNPPTDSLDARITISSVEIQHGGAQ